MTGEVRYNRRKKLQEEGVVRKVYDKDVI